MELLGFDVAQTPDQIKLLDEILDTYKITTYIELGTYRGGLSNYVLTTRPDIDYYGFDYAPEQIDERIRNHPRMITADVFSNGCKERILSIVTNSSGAVLIFCDNGNKPRELETYSPIIRSGDLIQVHDYPGEGITDEFLDNFGAINSSLREIQKTRIRGIGTSLWEKTR
jgi:predicted O-methyltransferase YrrM